MTELVLIGVRAGNLWIPELRLGAGLHPILARGAVGAALVAAIGGHFRARTGTLSVAGADPQRSPATRARVALLLASEPPLAARRVLDDVALSLGGEPRARDALAALGIGGWAERRARTLSPEERRSVALAVALAANEKLVLALFEPLASTPGLDRDRVLARLLAQAREGAVVVAVTQSPRDARSLGGRPHVLAHGRLARSDEVEASLAQEPRDFLVETAAPRALGARLLGDPAILGLSYDAAVAAGLLRVRVRDQRAGSLAILGAATELGATISALRCETPPFDRMELAVATSASKFTVPAAPPSPARAEAWTVARPFGEAPPPPPPPPGAPKLDAVAVPASTEEG